MTSGVKAGSFRPVHASFIGAAVAQVMGAIQRGGIQAAAGLDSAEAYRNLADLVLASLLHDWPSATPAAGCDHNDDLSLDESRCTVRIEPPGSRPSARLMTMRWIWLVPSKICMTFASRMYRSTGKSRE